MPGLGHKLESLSPGMWLFRQLQQAGIHFRRHLGQMAVDQSPALKFGAGQLGQIDMRVERDWKSSVHSGGAPRRAGWKGGETLKVCFKLIKVLKPLRLIELVPQPSHFSAPICLRQLRFGFCLPPRSGGSCTCHIYLMHLATVEYISISCEFK